MHRTPLLLIPSQLCTAQVWRHQIDALADVAECRVADHTGHSSMAGIAAAVLDSAPDRFALAAHGMGGFVSFEMLRQAPERITRLALLATLAAADGPPQRARREGYAQLVRQGRFAEVVEERLPILLHPSRRSESGLLAAAREMAQRTGPEAFLRQQRAIMDRPDSRAGLVAVRCPTWVIAARQDAIVSVVDAESMAAAIPGARLEIIEDCGHLATLEQPQAVSQLLRRWLRAPASG